MKQVFPYFLLIFLVFVSSFAFGQKDPKAKAILDGMSKKYQSLNGFTANFDFTYSDAGVVQDRQQGELAVKGQKYRLKLPDQEIFNDGKTVWTFIQSEGYKEVTINDVSQMEGELTPSNIYKMYETGYNYRLLADNTYKGKPVQVVLLIAQKADSPFKEVKLMVDKNTQDLLAWEMSDGQGGTLSYSFREMKQAPSLSAEYFVFDPKKYPGIEVIDLR
ncbi:outer membrane lipoprotein carrier protein LolA [Algoriphagus confluentis]|uniref:Outer membrane lipoprotein carrier protein LolA n=1 Tax=Algoriphagus confluentis TaxID=1697556 RepID=A0ABQ6PMN3_9BACT|nr:hypothetical protein Aconfl_14400 [Algoriphagus confluentis]